MAALTPVTVRIAPGADLTADPSTWPFVDITEDVRITGETGVHIVLGVRDEAETADSATCRFVLNNRDGRYSPDNPLSPYYGLLDDGTPVEVLWRDSPRFEGYIFGLPTLWDRSGTDSWVPVECGGMLRILGQRKSPEQSAIHRFVMANNPLGYWPMDDIDGSTQARSAVGGQPMRQNELILSAQFGRGQLAPWLPAGLLTGQTNNGRLLAVVPGAPPGGWTADILFRVPPPASWRDEGPQVFQLRVNDDEGLQYWMQVRPADPPQLEVFVLDPAGSALGSGVGPIGNVLDGHPHHLRFRAVDQSSGTTVGMFVDVDGVNVIADLTDIGLTSPPQPAQVEVFWVQSGPNVLSVSVSNLALWGPTPPGLVDAFAAYSGYAGEPAGRRIERLCTEHGIPFTAIGDLDDTEPMGAQRPLVLLALVRECEAADMGLLSDGFGLLYRTRRSLYSQDVAFTIPPEALNGTPVPTRDDQRIRNDITVKRVSGGEVRLTDQEHIGRHGRYDSAPELNVASDARLPDLASWRLNLGTQPRFRWPLIPLRLHDDMPEVDARLALRLADRATLDLSELRNFPGLTADVLVVGWAETLRLSDALVDLHTLPAAPWTVGQYGDPGDPPAPDAPARYDTAGSEVVFVPFLAGTDTSLLVQTTQGPAWTTDGANLPMDIRCSGAQLRVTAIGAADGSNVQEFTVQAAPVNGVVKAISVGERVSLWTPARYGL